jgi:hypothetical protein
MKRILWLSLMGVLSVSTAFGGEKQPLVSPNFDPFSMHSIPKWYLAEMEAVGFYYSGKAVIDSDPAKAVKDFTLAEQYVGMALVNGGGASAQQMGAAIGKALSQAQQNVMKSKLAGNSNQDSNSGNNDNKTSSSHPLEQQVPKTNISVKPGAGLTHPGNSQSGLVRQHG